MSEIGFAVIADDLTGASDTGVQFARRGYETVVVFSGEERPEGDREVVVMDTDSRSMEADAAGRRVYEAAKGMVGAGIAYKKIDSTLRGNIAAEVRAMMAATGREKAVISPAFPAAGRTTSGGIQLVNGVPVHETEAANDPKTPVSEGDLAGMFSGFGEARVVGTETLKDTGAMREILGCCDFVIADATEDEHLARLVEAVERPSEYLWVGAAGLAGALCDSLGDRVRGSVRGPSGTPEDVILNGRPVLVVIGSLSGVSRGQLGFLEGREDVRCVPLTDVRTTLRAARGSLEAGKNTVLHSSQETGKLSPAGVAGMLSEVVAGLSDADAFGGLVLTGGDTAVAVGRRLGGRGVRLVDEVEPGVPAGVLVGPRPYSVVTKAGGFGGPETLSNALDRLSDGIRKGGA